MEKIGCLCELNCNAAVKHNYPPPPFLYELCIFCQVQQIPSIILHNFIIRILLYFQEGCRTVNSCTIFYKPHCGRALYNNLLWSNWSCNKLSNIILIGNSFNAMQERFSKSERWKPSLCVITINISSGIM